MKGLLFSMFGRVRLCVNAKIFFCFFFRPMGFLDLVV
jgi:hypothetical protein